MIGPVLGDYDRILVAFSGGKDSLACLLLLLEAGDPSGAVLFELPDGGLGRAGGAGPPGWRGRFPRSAPTCG